MKHWMADRNKTPEEMEIKPAAPPTSSFSDFMDELWDEILRSYGLLKRK